MTVLSQLARAAAGVVTSVETSVRQPVGLSVRWRHPLDSLWGCQFGGDVC